ncbi:MAG: hypothetical protein KC420_11900, partial [Myxococcales bacterium]|nr:hypothetical protein [Myxococcales bacterium]
GPVPRSPWLAALLSAALIAAGSPPARASEGAPGSDVVRLQGGGMVRGTIVELRPGDSVTILIAGESSPRTYKWEEIVNTELGDRPQPVAATPTPGPPAGPLPDLAEGGRGLPRLTIDARGRRPVHLFTVGDGAVAVSTASTSSTSNPTLTMTTVRSGMVLRSVCQAPCDQVIDGRAGYPFFFGGDRMPLSRPVYLNYAEGELHAEVKPGRIGMLIGGVFATSYGGAGVIVGGTLLGVAPDRLARPGGILLGAGAALMIAGIVMLVKGRTRYVLRRR